MSEVEDGNRGSYTDKNNPEKRGQCGSACG